MAPDRNREFREALEELDDETADALLQMLAEDPESIREYLANTGYITDDTNEGGVIRNEEAAVELGEAESRIKSIVEQVGNPRSTAGIIEELQHEDSDFMNTFRSANHRPWMNKKLNSLVEKGELGKFRDGREVKYTPDIETAVRYWSMGSDRLVENLRLSDADQIVSDTGMPRQQVLGAIRSLRE